MTAAPLRGDAGLRGEEARLTLRQPAGGRLGTHGPAGSGGLRREGAGWGWASRGCRRPPPEGRPHQSAGRGAGDGVSPSGKGWTQPAGPAGWGRGVGSPVFCSTPGGLAGKVGVKLQLSAPHGDRLKRGGWPHFKVSDGPASPALRPGRLGSRHRPRGLRQPRPRRGGAGTRRGVRDARSAHRGPRPSAPCAQVAADASSARAAPSPPRTARKSPSVLRDPSACHSEHRLRGPGPQFRPRCPRGRSSAALRQARGRGALPWRPGARSRTRGAEPAGRRRRRARRAEEAPGSPPCPPKRRARPRPESAAPGRARRVQAMEPAAAGFFEDDKDLDFYDFEPLPTLPEDEVRRRGTPPSLA